VQDFEALRCKPPPEMAAVSPAIKWITGCISFRLQKQLKPLHTI
jgi:hypothetical protein